LFPKLSPFFEQLDDVKVRIFSRIGSFGLLDADPRLHTILET
jgi:hypothetical protein